MPRYDLRTIQPIAAPCMKPRRAASAHDIAIVERVLHKEEESIRYEGELTICNLSPALRPPLRLCGVEADDILPLRSPCGCDQNDRIRLLLRCRVVDSCGRKCTGSAQIDVCVRPLPRRARGNAVRRGASIEIAHAGAFLANPACVCLDIRLLTLITGTPYLTKTNPCQRECPSLPLYPHAHMPPVKRHSAQRCKKGKNLLELTAQLE